MEGWISGRLKDGVIETAAYIRSSRQRPSDAEVLRCAVCDIFGFKSFYYNFIISQF